MVNTRWPTTVRQKQIVAAARKLIAKYGSEHLTVRRIAKEIGVSEGAVYRHFRSKADVLSFLIEDVENTLLAEVEASYSSASNTLEALENIIAGHISAVEQRKGITFQVIAEVVSLGNKKLNAKTSGAIAKYIGRIREILSEGVETGTIRSDIDVDTAATLFFGMIQGAVSMWTLNHSDFVLEEKYAPLWLIFREAIVKR
ncbi:MAG: TetR/AcrR family transcriptional regulator [Chloroflexota bacterium]